ncbi:flocculation protein FLO11 [Oreochromis niloticus]|uniref:flocculation protein FLO11 n=1 Tax=Oreochromis niloticus TaxID=8128 RepID=UPI000DF1C8A2|nr:reelin domain-containing protein 1 [Oreochromis niloticus]
MLSTLHCLGVCAVLFLLAPPTTSFSGGASHASCQEIIPGHIRAHSQDPQHRYVTIRTSASSYLPGQFITVTVRSSRDFMGFLLQARSSEGTFSNSGGSFGVMPRPKTRAGSGARKSRRGSPVLVGGSWILTPPGTHTLCCLSEGDTVTHSDKQLKRNLSFVWRAPDSPVGDIRFYITVVQSYFVYWAGIESGLVRDASRRLWSGSNTTRVNGVSAIFALLQDKVTALPKYLQNDSQTPLGSFSAVTEEAQIDPVPQPKDPKTSSPLTASFSSAAGMKTTTISSSKNTVQTLSSPLLVPVIPLKEKELPKFILPDPKSPNTPEIEDTTTSRAISSTNHSFHNTKLPTPTTHNPKTAMQEEKGSAKFRNQSPKNNAEIGIQSQNPHSQTSSPKPTSHFEVYTPILLQTSTSHNYPFPSASSSKFLSHFQTFSPHSIPPSKSPIVESYTISFLTHSENSPFESKSSPKQTSTLFSKLQTIATVLSSSPHREYIRNFRQDIPETTPTKSQGQTSITWTDYSQSEIAPEVSSTSPQPRSQPIFQIGQKQTPSSKSLFNTLLFTLRTDQTPILEKSQVDFKTEAKIRTTSPVFALPSATPSLSASAFSHLFDSSSFSSSNTLPTAAAVNDRSTNSPHPSGGSSLVTMRPSIRSTFVIPSSFFTRNQPTTSPTRSALHSPSPISSPPYLSSSQPTPTSPQPSSFASSTIPYLYTSNNPSSDVLFTPAPLPTFTSSQCITNSTNSSISFVSSTTSSSSTSATSSSYQGTSSFYIPSVTFPPTAQSTSLHPGPSPAPRRSLYNFSMPSPSQKHTEGHTASSDPDPSIHQPTPRTNIHPNPKPHPNIKENLGHELKPNLPNTDAKHPSSPPATPDKEGKYPDISRHSAWELGMLLGSSAGLGMVLVVGIRYMYRQVCGKRTQVTLNDREREYGRGEIGLIHVQECGDLVRVRKIRENSLVLLAEYDVLSPPGERNAGCQQRC